MNGYVGLTTAPPECMPEDEHKRLQEECLAAIVDQSQAALAEYPSNVVDSALRQLALHIRIGLIAHVYGDDISDQQLTLELNGLFAGDSNAAVRLGPAMFRELKSQSVAN